MASTKQGLSYYNVDTDRYSDRRIKRLKKTFGGNGLAVYDYILCECYRDKGCGLEWDNDTAFDVAEYFGLKETLIEEIVRYCGSVGLFNKALLSRGIITSQSIQKRYLTMCSRAKRTVAIIPEEWKILPEECDILPEEKTITPDRARILKEKKSKVNNNLSLTPSLRVERDAEAAEPQIDKDTFFEIFFFRNFRRPMQEAERFLAHYQANGWCRNGQSRPVKDKIALAYCWTPADDSQRFSQDFLDNWRELYQAAKKRNVEAAKRLLTGIYTVEVTATELKMRVSKSLKETFYRNVAFFNDEFFVKFYGDKKVVWL